MNRLIKILLNLFFGLVALTVASVVILIVFTINIAHYDTFTGNINKLPVVIRSPASGQILTLTVHEGDTVHKGQTLATIHVLSSAPIAVAPLLYRVEKTQVSVLSPSDAVVGLITFDSLSTVVSSDPLMYLYGSRSFDVQIEVTQGHALSDYTAFYAQNLPDQHQYTLHVIEQIPTNVIGGIDPTTVVYRASCTNCQAILYKESVAIQALHKQPASPVLDEMRSLLNQLQILARKVFP